MRLDAPSFGWMCCQHFAELQRKTAMVTFAGRFPWTATRVDTYLWIGYLVDEDHRYSVLVIVILVIYVALDLSLVVSKHERSCLGSDLFVLIYRATDLSSSLFDDEEI